MAWAGCGVRSELKQRFQYHFIVLWTLENLPLVDDIRNKFMIAANYLCLQEPMEWFKVGYWEILGCSR